LINWGYSIPDTDFTPAADPRSLPAWRTGIAIFRHLSICAGPRGCDNFPSTSCLELVSLALF
jgi:hypothetical protein